MNARFDSDPDLDEDDIPDASELLDFELIAKSQPDKGQGLWLWVVLVLIVAGGGWAGWMYLQEDPQEMVSADGVPLIAAPQSPLKEKPTDPGGMDVPDRDKLVYGRMAGEGAPEPGVERLLPPPESPLEPPQAAPGAVPEVVQDAPSEAPDTQPQASGSSNKVVVAMPPPPVAPAVAPPAAPPAAPVANVEAAAAPESAPVAAPDVASAPVAAEVSSTFKATAPAGQGYLVQLSAVRTEDVAKAEWARAAQKNADILGGLEPVIQRADLGTKGIYYRVRGGWFASRAEAKAVCDELVRRNVGCIIAKP